ncbi:hypothetical protein HMPREF1319_1625 [Capnocytophaga ochracea str. Holt 25]|nr:hypothetical protein HMPREF1319_1625 [Capnocytophaga ochracea str. Holt 25]
MTEKGSNDGGRMMSDKRWGDEKVYSNSYKIGKATPKR